MKKLKLSVKNKEPVPCGQPLPQQGGCRLLAKKTGALLSLAAVLHMNYAPLTLAATVSAGTSATGEILNNDDLQNVYGTATSTTISGGEQRVSSGGLATSTTIHTGGSQVVYTSGSASDTTIHSGGVQIVIGGSATSTTISGGLQVVSNGGSASDTTIHSGGGQNVSNGGTATSTIISSGRQYVFLDGSATSTTIHTGGSQVVHGTANDTTISGGLQRVSNGGLATSTTINSGGVQFVIGGTANDTTINSRGEQRVSNGGLATSTTIYASGVQFVIGGLASDTTIHSRGGQAVDSGGLATSTTINSGGLQTIYDGSATSTTICSGGSQYIYNGGTATSTTINSGGSQFVGISGFATSTTINSRGEQVVDNGGSATSTTISAGGVQYIHYSGSATSTTISSGGAMHLYGGGSAVNATLLAGAELAIARGTLAAVYNSGTTDFTDKKLSFYLDGAVDGDIMLSTNTALQVTDATDITLLYATSSNLSSGDTLTLVDNTTANNDFTSGSKTTSVYGGGTKIYDFDLFKDDVGSNALKATFQGVNQSLTTESAKAYLEGAFSKLSHLGAADNTAQESLQTAWQSGYGRDGFFAFNGGKTKTKTGSYVDANHFNLAGGISHKKELKNGRSLMTAILLEGGWGSYDTYNSFSTGQVRGSGDTSHYGLGLAVKNSDSNGRYLEGSLRAGRVESDYKTGDMGTGADFETKSTYWSAHIGLGRARQLKDGDLLDTYLKLFHTRQGSDSVHTGAGERLELDSANSTRLRLGARYTKGFHEKTSYYAGLALEYEFSGKQGGSIDGVRIDAPDMKGSSAMLELGAKYELSKGWSADFALQGLVGKRQGIGGNLMFNYRF